jgi:hypothetical protein
MTDNIPVAMDTTLPAFLLNLTIVDVEVDYVTDNATGERVKPDRFKCSQIRGFTMSLHPLPHLRSFCLFMGLVVPDDAMQSSLLEALATKKLQWPSFFQEPSIH